jgi:arginase family enzyme
MRKGTFARIADIHEVSEYEIAVLGVPFDGETSYRPGINIVGTDVVEVAPAYDHAEITCVAAATVVFDLLSLIVANSSPRA